MHDEFRNQVANSPVLKERFQAIYNAIADDVEADTGARPAPEDIIPMSCVRTAVYANSSDWTAWREESALIPAIAKAKERQRLQAALDSDGDSPEARQVAAQLAELSPAQRLAFVRENGLTGAAKAQNVAKGERTPEQTAELLRQNSLLSGGRKIAHAREHGLI